MTSSSSSSLPVLAAKPSPALSTLHESRSVTDLPSTASAQPSPIEPQTRRHVPSLSQSLSSGGQERPISALDGVGWRGNEVSSSQQFNPRSTLSSKDTSTDQGARLHDPSKLLRLQHGVIKSRSGSVLGRGFILKNDRLPPRSTRSLEFSLKGAPNFRSGGESIYGSAQPSITGLRTVLSTLSCNPGGSGRAVWICTREEPVIYIGGSPFVLRDAEAPLQNYSLSERPEALESIENRSISHRKKLSTTRLLTHVFVGSKAIYCVKQANMVVSYRCKKKLTTEVPWLYSDQRFLCNTDN